VLRDALVSAYVPLSFLARGRRFYEEVLRQQPRRVGDTGVRYECGNHSTFFVYLGVGAGSSTAS
jgi:hypothetical protein